MTTHISPPKIQLMPLAEARRAAVAADVLMASHRSGILLANATVILGVPLATWAGTALAAWELGVGWGLLLVGLTTRYSGKLVALELATTANLDFARAHACGIAVAQALDRVRAPAARLMAALGWGLPLSEAALGIGIVLTAGEGHGVRCGGSIFVLLGILLLAASLAASGHGRRVLHRARAELLPGTHSSSGR